MSKTRLSWSITIGSLTPDLLTPLCQPLPPIKADVKRSTKVTELPRLTIVCVFSYSGGEAIWIDGEISNGRSMKSDTFFNAPLTSNVNGDFVVARLDAFGFQ